MEYLKIINLLNNTPNQPSKFRTRNWSDMMNYKELMMLIRTVNVNPQWLGKAYVNIGMQTYMLKEL